MSQHIEWATGLGDFTVLRGQWVDAYGSRNEGPAIWSGSNDGVIIEWPDVATAVAQLRAVANAMEAADTTQETDTCRCGKKILHVPQTMDEDEDWVWVHDDEVGAEVSTHCTDDLPIVPAGQEDADDDDDV